MTCRLYGHCATCRKDADWRAKVAMPEVCPLGYTADKLPLLLGDKLSAVATPIARALKRPCVDKETGELKPASKCAKIRDALNRL